jgi:hypothetical protein
MLWLTAVGLLFILVGTLLLGFDAIKLLFVGMDKQIADERSRRHDTSPAPVPGRPEFNLEWYMIREIITRHRNPVAVGFVLLLLGFGLQFVALFV